MSWQYGWGVEYQQRGHKWKTKNFKFDEKAARAFYTELKENECMARLFRYRPTTRLDQIMEAQLTWLGIQVPVIHLVSLVLVISALMVLWHRVGAL